MTDVKLLKFLVVGIYGVHEDGVLVAEIPTIQIPLFPGKRMTFEELDAALTLRITSADIDQALTRPIV